MNLSDITTDLRPNSNEPSGLSSVDHRSTGLQLVWHLWCSRFRIAKFAAAGLILGIVIALVSPVKFESTARILPPESRGGALGLLASVASGSSSGSNASSSGGGAEAALAPIGSGSTYIAVLRSDTVEIRILDRFDLRTEYREKRTVDALEALAKNVSVEEDRRLGVITLKVTDRDPKRAADIGNAFIEELNTSLSDLDTSAAHRERVFLEQQLKVIKQQLADAEKSQAEFSTKNATLDLKDQAHVEMEAAGKVNAELVAAEAELNSLRVVFGDKHVRVRAAESRVARLRQELDAMSGAASASSGPSNTGFPSLRKLPGLGMSYADLYRQTRILESVYETLTKQYELAKVQEAKEIPRVRVLDPARVPERKSEPKRTAIVVVSTILAGLAGMAWIVGLWYWVRVDESDPTKALILRIAGEVTQPRASAPPQS